MSSINEMISKQFEKQVLRQVKELSYGKEYTLFETTEVDDEDKRRLIMLSFLLDEDADALVINHNRDELKKIKDWSEKDDNEKELIAKELVRLSSHYTKTKELCCDCKMKCNFVSDLLGMNTNKHLFISNYCEECGNDKLTKLNKFVNQGIDVEKLACDVCYENCVMIKAQDEKIKYTEILEIYCCKDKYICMKCRNNCGRCPFCRQGIKWRYM